MKIFDPAVYIEKYDGMKIMKNIEKAARTCYKSEANISEDSYKRIITNCLKSGHESIIEHEKISVKVFGDLSLMQDIPGHRLASFSNESTRYCNYGKNKYENQLRMIIPYSTALEMNLTCNIREWRHLLSLRTTFHVHPSIRQLLIPVLVKFKQDMPELFADIEYDTEFPKEKYAKVLPLQII